MDERTVQVEELLQKLDAKEPETRADAAKAFFRLAFRIGEAHQHLWEAHKDAWTAPVVSKLANLLQHDREANVRIAAVCALHELGSASVPAIPVLVLATEDSYFAVRSLAAHALGDIGLGEKQVVVPALEKLLNDSHGGPRAYAGEALARLTLSPSPRRKP